MIKRHTLVLEAITDDDLCSDDCPFLIRSDYSGIVMWRCRLFGPLKARLDYGPTSVNKPGGADPMCSEDCLAVREEVG